MGNAFEGTAIRRRKMPDGDVEEILIKEGEKTPLRKNTGEKVVPIRPNVVMGKNFKEDLESFKRRKKEEKDYLATKNKVKESLDGLFGKK